MKKYEILGGNLPVVVCELAAGESMITESENRTITPREAARIQSFPDDFIFTGANREISRQIGNAVPPKISYFLAMVINEIERY